MALSTTFTQCALKSTKFGIITQNKAISPFKVADFGTNQKLSQDRDKWRKNVHLMANPRIEDG